MFTAIREVQIPLLAALLFGAFLAKLARTMRTGSVDDAFGPTALFPMQLRKPLAIAMLVVECALGVGLVVTAAPFAKGLPADSIRLATGLMFLVATSALIELRTAHPDVGCGCFGDFSSAPVSGRTLARSALLSVAALSTVRLTVSPPHPSDVIRLLVIMAVELVILGALSPELGEGLIRLGYSEPCELRAMPAERTLAALRRSKHWRRHARLVSSETPTDVWRELCWRYLVFPVSSESGRRTELVFAVFLHQRRPAVHVALVDGLTGERMPLPQRSRIFEQRRRLRAATALANWTASNAAPTPADIPVSSEL